MHHVRNAITRWTAVLLLLLGILLTLYQLVQYSQLRATLPPGTRLAGIPVAGLERKVIGERLVNVYSVPIEVHYNDAVFQIRPSVAGFQMDLQSMLAAADEQRIAKPFWQDFWNYLWNRLPEPIEIPIHAEVSTERLRDYLLSEVAPRYDRIASSALPVAATGSFQPGQPGTSLDVDRAVILITDALMSPTNRTVNLSYSTVDPTRPSFPNLQIMMQQVLQTNNFDGLAEIYLLDVQTGQEINFAYNNGSIIAPEVAFTAASVVKIPIMVSVFRHLPEPTPAEALQLMESMIELSENGPADQLMRTYLDRNLGPLMVTEDMQTLGLKNTFLAGYFAPASPLLQEFKTNANQRADVSTNPDPYNQTTPVNIGSLLSDIYQCASMGGGPLVAAFPGEISQNECRLMISFLSKNKIAALTEAGVPDGTQVAHKHGWTFDPLDGLMHSMCDAAIVYTPGGNFIFAIYLYHPTQLVYDPANKLIATIAASVYNFYNIPTN